MTQIFKKLKVPVIAAPMFLISSPNLVISQCRAGIIGSFPALNPRTEPLLDSWLTEITQKISSPYAVNLIVHKSNPRLAASLEIVKKHKGAVKHVVDEIHSYGGLVYHDVTNITHAAKAINVSVLLIQAGVDGLIAVCAGAGGHAGLANPMSFMAQLRFEFPNVPICIAGGIVDGYGVRAARSLGAQCAYIGTRFIATKESNASDAYKNMIIDSKTGPAPSFLPVVYTDSVSGVHANFLRESVETIDLSLKGTEDFSKLHADGKSASGKAWKDVWSAGHGVLGIRDLPTVQELIDRMKEEYDHAKQFD